MGTVHQQHNSERTLSSYGNSSLLPHLLDYLRYSFLTSSDFITFGTMNRAKQTDPQFSTNQRKCVCFGSKLFLMMSSKLWLYTGVILSWNSYDKFQVPFLDDCDVRVLHTKLRRNYLYLTKCITLHLLAYIETHLLVDVPFHKAQKINLELIPISLTLNYLEGLKALYILH